MSTSEVRAPAAVAPQGSSAGGPPASHRPSRGRGPYARRDDAARAAVAAADALTDGLVLGGPGVLSVAMRHSPTRINAWLARSDASQRPWGVTLGPPARERFVLEAPGAVGGREGGAVVVRGQAVQGFGVSLSPGLALPLLGLFGLLATWLPTLPKVVLGAATALALGLVPRFAFGRHAATSRRLTLSPEALAEVAAHRAGALQALLVFCNLDGLRALPAPLRASDDDGLPGLHGEHREERATVSEWGFGLSCGPALLCASFGSSWLSHHSHAHSLSITRTHDDLVRVQLSEVLAQPWRATFFDGLLWGTEHRGVGRQLVRVSVCERAPDDRGLATLLAQRRGVLEGTDELALGMADAAVLQVEQVQSAGAGWRWPFVLPFAKTLGLGAVRQRFVVTRGGAEATLGRVALGVLGMDETLPGGRVHWEIRVSWQADAGAPVDRTTGPAACRVALQVYVPWCSQQRRAALVDALGLPELTRQQVRLPAQAGWRRDLRLRLGAHVSSAALTTPPLAGPGATPTATRPSLGTEVHALGRLLRRAVVSGAALEADLGDDALFDAMAGHGPRFFAALLAEGETSPPHLSARYGQTEAVLQNAAWHLAAQRPGQAPSYLWRRRTRGHLRALAAESHALSRCPFTRAMAPLERAEACDALAVLHRRLLPLSRPPPNERTPLLPR